MQLLELCSDVMESELCHPLTGEPLRAFTLPSGRVVWPILGGAESDEDDDDSEDDEDDDDADQDDDDSDDEDDDDSSSKSKKKEEDPRDKRIRELTADKIKFRKERNQLRAEQAQIKADLEKLKDKDAPELETVTKERDEARKRAELAEATLHDQAVQLAFFQVDGYNWKNPADALQLARRELKDVDVDEGEADRDAVAAIVEQLAKEKPYLLAEDAPKSGRGNPKGDPDRDTGAGGSGRTRRRKGGLDEKAIADKYKIGR